MKKATWSQIRAEVKQTHTALPSLLILLIDVLLLSASWLLATHGSWAGWSVRRYWWSLLFICMSSTMKLFTWPYTIGGRTMKRWVMFSTLSSACRSYPAASRI